MGSKSFYFSTFTSRKFRLRIDLVILVIGALSTSLTGPAYAAAADSNSALDLAPPAPSLQEYKTNMPVIQEMLKISCANQQLDDGRALIANSTYQKSNAILTDLQADIQKNTQFLSNPTATVQSQVQARALQASQTAQGRLQSAQDVYEYNQRLYQLGLVDKDTLNKNKQALMSAENQSNAADQPPAADSTARLISNLTTSSMTSLKQLQDAAHEVQQASAQAEGCYLTASGTGTPSTASIEENSGSTVPGAASASSSANNGSASGGSLSGGSSGTSLAVPAASTRSR
jgi:hypothetical protein